MKKLIFTIFCIIISIQSVFAFPLTGKGFFGIFESIFGRDSPVGCGPGKCGPTYCAECEQCDVDEIYIEEECRDICTEVDSEGNCVETEEKCVGGYDTFVYWCVPTSKCECNSCSSGNCECIVSDYKKIKCITLRY